MTTRSIKKPSMETVKSLRICLGCGEEFNSEGPHNRICKLCKGVDDRGFRGRFGKNKVPRGTFQDSQIRKVVVK